MLTEAEQASILTPEQRRKPEPLPPMNYQPQHAAHAASEIEDEQEPLQGSDWLWIRVLAWASIVIIVGGVAVVLR